MRGKGPAQHRATGCSGITPACAGKRKRIAGRLRLRQDHPRVCGEETHGTRGLARPSGSPPRMRGRGMYAMHPARAWGITPAYAGKSKRLAACAQTAEGSPPRMRGKVNGGIGRTEMFGITPAYAGKRTALQRQQSQSWDHPRVCGEKVTLVRLSASVQGSPPRMRGKDCHAAGCLPGGRITPAYAGKRRAAVCRGGERWDHPRVCGEKSRAKMELSRNQGITPAYAGKSVLSFGACIV